MVTNNKESREDFHMIEEEIGVKLNNLAWVSGAYGVMVSSGFFTV